MTTIIEHKGIATIIGTSQLSVPTHQRSFEWTRDEVAELLNDVDEAFKRGREEYFLGSIVVIAAPGVKHHDVLDGQQRLATVSLLLAAIADAFARLGEAKAADKVRQGLTSYDIDLSADIPHLRLNLEDDPYFRKLLQSPFPPPVAGAPESHALLFGARKQIDAWVVGKTPDIKTGLPWLRDLERYLRDSVRVIYFGVPDDANAYLIFETLNDRGLDLSIADLLKNYLLGSAGEDLDAVLVLWSRTLNTLKAFGYEKEFTAFLRHYWSSRHELVREKELYRQVKNRVSGSENVLAFAEDLGKNSYYYTALLSPEHEYWSAASEKTRDRLRTLLVLGLEQYRPMLLAALAHFEVKDVERVVSMLEAWNVRLMIVGALGSGILESRYAELGRAIRSGDVKNIKELAARAHEFVPGDVDFVEQFALARVSKVTLARYYLKTLERVAGGDAETVPSPTLTLEHILPERPGTNYPEFSEEEKKLYTRRLGNLTLLAQRLNAEMKSAPFREKCDIYRESSLLITKDLSKLATWNVEAVESRQRRLAEIAAKAWPRDPK